MIAVPRPLIDSVSALYINPRGPYPALVSDCWPETRDARQYAGPNPVVAHPPCGPWGRFRNLCTKQDATTGPAAVAAVRRWGGVLEHPECSRLWRACLMPFPGELPDAWGGRSYLVRQVSWGHACVKPTWLYVVGVDALDVLDGVRVGGEAAHRMGRLGPKSKPATHVAKALRNITPPAFAAWLVSLASRARSPQERTGSP